MSFFLSQAASPELFRRAIIAPFDALELRIVTADLYALDVNPGPAGAGLFRRVLRYPGTLLFCR